MKTVPFGRRKYTSHFAIFCRETFVHDELDNIVELALSIINKAA